MEGLVRATFWVDVGEARELAACGVLVEILEGGDIGAVRSGI
jgi:hypothetical protein